MSVNVKCLVRESRVHGKRRMQTFTDYRGAGEITESFCRAVKVTFPP